LTAPHPLDALAPTEDDIPEKEILTSLGRNASLRGSTRPSGAQPAWKCASTGCLVVCLRLTRLHVSGAPHGAATTPRPPPPADPEYPRAPSKRRATARPPPARRTRLAPAVTIAQVSQRMETVVLADWRAL